MLITIVGSNTVGPASGFAHTLRRTCFDTVFLGYLGYLGGNLRMARFWTTCLRPVLVGEVSGSKLPYS